MYAVIAAAGKQFCVEEGQVLEIDLRGEEPGKTIEFDRVLLVGGNGKTVVGTPTVSGAKVTAQIVEHFRGKKIHVLFYKRRKNYRRHKGHRQELTRIKIDKIFV